MSSLKKEKIKKILPEHIYAFNIDLKRNAGRREKKLNFEMLNQGFYEELLSYDVNLRKNRFNLSQSKQNGIKEAIYSNSLLPQTWKNKLSYYNDIYQTLSGDKHFVAYLGKSIGENSLNENNKKTLLLENSLDEGSKDYKNTSLNASPMNTHKRGYGFSLSKYDKKNINDLKEIYHLLEEYKANYPIKLQREIFNDNQTKGTLISSLPNISVKETKSSFSNINNKSLVFKSTMYNKLIPDTGNQFSPIINKVGKKKEDIPKFGPYLNGSYESFNRKIEIKNPKIEMKLKDIEYYGPLYSHCPSCRNRNHFFYNTMEPNQCLNLLTYLRNYRKKSRYNSINMS